MKPLLSAIVRFSLRFRGTVVALGCVITIYGLFLLSRAQYDVFPEFAPPQATIQTEAPGLSPEQVATLVTQPIENSINGVTGIDTLRSASIQGLSVITVTFHNDNDIYRSRQMLAERLTNLQGQLPQGVLPPRLNPLTSSTSVILTIGLTSDQHSLMELRSMADWMLKPRLLAVPGVAKVTVHGGEIKQLQIQLQPKLLVKYGLSLNEVLTAAQNATAIVGAGFVDNQNQRILLQTAGQTLAPQELAKTVIVHQNNGNITLGDVANVTIAPMPLIGAATVMGKPGIQLIISEQYGANTLQVTHNLEQSLQTLIPALQKQGVAVQPTIFRAADFIEIATHNIKVSLLIGALLVVAVLFTFLFNWRAAAISLLAIPLSLLSAIIIFNLMGLSLNTMTLGGLAIAIGLLVDDAVITVENIFRRLHQNAASEHPISPLKVAMQATLEVRSAVVYATLAIALVFIPVITMSSLAGRLFAPLGIAYIVATLSSLLVAVTLTPALCLMLLRKEPATLHESPFVHSLKARYQRLLHYVELHHKPVIATVIASTLAGLLMLPFVGGSFLPELNEGHFIVHMNATPGTSLQESTRLGNLVTQTLLKLPAVATVAQHSGRAEAGDDIPGTHQSEFDVKLKPEYVNDTEAAAQEIRNVLAPFLGVNFAIETPLSERIEETLSGYTAAVVINVFGNEPAVLDQKAAEIASLLNTIPGAADVQVQSPSGVPQLMIRLKPDALARFGFTSVEVQNVIRTAYQGDIVGQLHEGNQITDIAVILDPFLRNQVTEVKNLLLRNSSGVYVPLQQLADIYAAPGRYLVLHDGARPVQTITCNVTGRDSSSFVAEAKKQIASKIILPAGAYVEFLGEAEAQTQATRDLIVHALLTGAGIILLLSLFIASRRNLLLVMTNLPFALVGGVLAIFVSGGKVSIGSLVGFVTLFGITLRNAVMLLSHYEHLITQEGLPWNLETAVRGAMERISPILMTALVTALGLLPLAIGSETAGREIEGPMAMVILGGLMTSTALNLLVLPTLALRYGRFRMENSHAFMSD